MTTPEELSAKMDELIADARAAVRAGAQVEYDDRIAAGYVPLSIRDAFVEGAVWQAERVIANARAEHDEAETYRREFLNDGPWPAHDYSGGAYHCARCGAGRRAGALIRCAP